MMAIFPNSILRDMSQNNIDFVSKQIGRILDALYGEQAQPTDTIPSDAFVFHTRFYFGDLANNILNSAPVMSEFGIYDCTVDSFGLNIQGVGEVPFSYDSYYSQSQLQDLENVVNPYLGTFAISRSMSDLNIDHWKTYNNTILGIKNNQEQALAISQSFGVDTNKSVNIQGLKIENQQLQTLSISDYGDRRFANITGISSAWTDSWSYSNKFPLSAINDTYYPSNFVLVPSSDSDGITNITNNYYENTYNLDGDTVHNYYNDRGDLVINGGGLGIAPVVGLNYNDFKLILDSLVDSLNLQFNFDEPLEYAPTWEELHYIDQGSFYITPIKQLGPLPVAPDLADTVIDISEPVGVLVDGFDGVLGAFDALGITLMVSFTFIARLCIRKLRGE